MVLFDHFLPGSGQMSVQARVITFNQREMMSPDSLGCSLPRVDVASAGRHKICSELEIFLLATKTNGKERQS